MNKELIYPKALKRGDTIGVVAPSSYWDIKKLAPSVEFLEKNGFKVVFHPNIEQKHGQFAGTAEERANSINDYFKNPDIDAIFCTCGGNGAIHLLDLLDYEAIQQNPKIFIGFSDITILLNAISAKTGLVTFHGPTLTRFKKIQPHWTNQMLDILSGQLDHVGLPGEEHQDIKSGGILWGGNLSALQTLIGTPLAPDMNDSVLMLEDINDHLSRYDRMLGHLRQAKWLKSCNIILLGEFLKSQDNHERPFGFTMEEIIESSAPDIPVIEDTPIGHGERLCTLPIGAEVILKNNKLSFKSLA
jgi:muramoyltetrapeptide carboxypeptidase